MDFSELQGIVFGKVLFVKLFCECKTFARSFFIIDNRGHGKVK